MKMEWEVIERGKLDKPLCVLTSRFHTLENKKNICRLDVKKWITKATCSLVQQFTRDLKYLVYFSIIEFKI